MLRFAAVFAAATLAFPFTSRCSRRLDQYVVNYDRVTIRGVHIIDIEHGQVLPSHDVSIVNGTIRAIHPTRTKTRTAGDHVIDGRGKFLIPGLADMHVHHYTGYSDNDFLLYLVNGVTTVRNMRGSEKDLNAKKRIAAGNLIGPRYYTCGPLSASLAKTAVEAQREVEEQKRAGYDCIKVYSGTRRAAFRRVIETARRLRIPAVGHAQVRLGVDETIKLRSIEHLEEWLDLFRQQPPDSSLHSVLARRMASEHVFVTPTLVGVAFHKSLKANDLEAQLARPETRFLSPYWFKRVTNADDDAYRNLRRLGYRRAKRRYDLALEYADFLNREGVPLLLGTDTTGFIVPGFSVHDELETLVRAGLSPRDALRTGTSNVADFLGPSHGSGRIAVGKRADLVLLDADPLEDIRNTRRIAGVMFGSRWIDRAAIRHIMQRLQKR